MKAKLVVGDSGAASDGLLQCIARDLVRAINECGSDQCKDGQPGTRDCADPQRKSARMIVVS